MLLYKAAVKFVPDFRRTRAQKKDRCIIDRCIAIIHSLHLYISRHSPRVIALGSASRQEMEAAPTYLRKAWEAESGSMDAHELRLVDMVNMQ